jgi:hypothetical protein
VEYDLSEYEKRKIAEEKQRFAIEKYTKINTRR